MGNRIKFLYNNYNSSSVVASYTFSSENAGYPAANLQDDFRTKPWRSNGNFEIDWSNYQFVIDDSSEKTVTLTRASYTAATLATEIQTQLNAVSSSFTVSYSTTTNKFTIARGSSFSIIWTKGTQVAKTLGFNEEEDDTGLTSYEADDTRVCYPSEWIKFDFGITRNPKGLIIIDALDENIKIQPSASIKLQGSPSDNWNSPEEVSLTYNAENITEIDINGIFTRAYRYNRLFIEDKTNPLGYVQIGKVYLGDCIELESSDVQREFSESFVDLSKQERSIGGEIYTDIRPSYSNHSSVMINLCNKNDVDTIKEIYSLHKTYKPFFVSIDSDAKATNNINEWTKYVRFSSPPVFQTVTKDYWNVSFGLDEVI